MGVAALEWQLADFRSWSRARRSGQFFGPLGQENPWCRMRSSRNHLTGVRHTDPLMNAPSLPLRERTRGLSLRLTVWIRPSLHMMLKHWITNPCECASGVCCCSSVSMTSAACPPTGMAAAQLCRWYAYSAWSLICRSWAILATLRPAWSESSTRRRNSAG